MALEAHAATYLEVLDDEYWALEGQPPTADATELREKYVTAMLAQQPDCAKQEAAFRLNLMQRLHHADRSAICFSGGGIRSATFGLGVLQGLARASADTGARPRLLGELDFISTVSGGGYLGAWFSAWATRLAKNAIRGRDCVRPDLFDGPAEVIRQLAAPGEAVFDPDVPPVRHLRSYTNYLTPKLGALSGDTWALVGSVVRNLFLNWLVLLPLMAALLLVPLGARYMMDVVPGPKTLWAVLLSGLAFGALATGYVGYDLPSAGNAGKRHVWWVWLCQLPLTVAAVHLNTFWAWLPAISDDTAWWNLVGLGRDRIAWWHFAAFGTIMHAGGMLMGILLAMFHFKRPAPVIGLYAAAAAGLTGAIGGLLGYVLTGFAPLFPADAATTTRYTIVAFPTVIGIFLFAGALLVGLTSYITEDTDREWWARSGGLLLAVAIAWLVFASTVLLAGPFLHWLKEYALAKLAAATGVTGWAAARLAGSSSTPATTEEESKANDNFLMKARFTDSAARLVLPVFIVLLAMLLAVLNEKAVLLLWRSLYDVTFETGLDAMVRDAIGPVLAVGGIYLVVGLVSSFFINVNSFSLHAMYRQRLIRAYLGASNSRRVPHWFTGFDEHDNIPMCGLTTHRPLHVVNIALNLVSGANLAWQQRKAESFTSTRLHTGSCRVGYRPSQEYGGHYKPQRKNSISLGTAMTISGAAASPNMGYHSSPLLTLVMTLFNARLGWWLGNPRATGDLWKLPGPRFGVRPFIDEAFGLTNDQNTWIYLSDGGHFENLGLYEMVLRRCRTIIVSDAAEDPKFAFEDLGNAIRKIRIDLGIAIEFPKPLPMSPEGRSTTVRSAHHCAIGTICYDAIEPGAPPGTLLYLKASLSGDEPVDVLHYAAQNKAFPHQTTTDQFFDESQFESYRRLGLHIVERICGTRLADDPPAEKGPVHMDLASFAARAEAYAAGPVA